MMAGPFAIACLVLATAGVAKAVKPGDTARALALFGWPVGFTVVRIGGVVEVGLATAALLSGSSIAAALVGVSYLAFAIWVTAALNRGVPISSCGCFGVADSAPTYSHVLANVGAAAVSVAAALAGRPSLPAVLRDQPGNGVPFLALVVVGTGLASLVFTALPDVHRARRSG